MWTSALTLKPRTREKWKVSPIAKEFSRYAASPRAYLARSSQAGGTLASTPQSPSTCVPGRRSAREAGAGGFVADGIFAGAPENADGGSSACCGSMAGQRGAARIGKKFRARVFCAVSAGLRCCEHNVDALRGGETEVERDRYVIACAIRLMLGAIRLCMRSPGSSELD